MQILATKSHKLFYRCWPFCIRTILGKLCAVLQKHKKRIFHLSRLRLQCRTQKSFKSFFVNGQNIQDGFFLQQVWNPGQTKLTNRNRIALMCFSIIHAFAFNNNRLGFIETSGEVVIPLIEIFFESLLLP